MSVVKGGKFPVDLAGQRVAGASRLKRASEGGCAVAFAFREKDAKESAYSLGVNPNVPMLGYAGIPAIAVVFALGCDAEILPPIIKGVAADVINGEAGRRFQYQAVKIDIPEPPITLAFVAIGVDAARTLDLSGPLQRPKTGKVTWVNKCRISMRERDFFVYLHRPYGQAVNDFFPIPSGKDNQFRKLVGYPRKNSFCLGCQSLTACFSFLRW